MTWLCFTHTWTVDPVASYILSDGQCIPLKKENKSVPWLITPWNFGTSRKNKDSGTPRTFKDTQSLGPVFWSSSKWNLFALFLYKLAAHK